MSDTRARVLRTLRNPKLVNGIGLGLVALVVAARLLAAGFLLGFGEGVALVFACG